MTPVNSRLMRFITAPSSKLLTYTLLSGSATFFLFMSHSAKADDALKMSLTAGKIIIKDSGKQVYVPVNTAQVGTVIQYRATYRNTLSRPIQNTTVTLPIPANTEFTGEAYPPSAQGSVDYHNYTDIPLMRIIKGKLVEVPFSEYKSLRWDIKFIPAHKSIDVAFNTIVN